MTDHKWQVGQQAAINRRTIVTVQKVTPTGRVTAGGRVFNPDGYERVAHRGRWTRYSTLHPLTPEIQEEIALVEDGERAFRRLRKALDGAEKLLNRLNKSWDREVPRRADIDRAERLAAAIEGATGAADGEGAVP